MRRRPRLIRVERLLELTAAIRGLTGWPMEDFIPMTRSATRYHLNQEYVDPAIARLVRESILEVTRVRFDPTLPRPDLPAKHWPRAARGMLRLIEATVDYYLPRRGFD